MFRIFALSIFTVFAVFTFAASAAAQFAIPGEVVDVIDGKTVLVAIPGGKVKVELQFIDVPEPGQQLHDTVKEHLRTLLLGKSVEYRPRTITKDRAIGRLIVKKVDVSQQMLRDGAAWHLPLEGSGQDKSEFDVYASNEAVAKNEKIGVWSIPGLKPAWEVRANNLDIARQKEKNAALLKSDAEDNEPQKRGMRLTSNPAFGDVGALLNRYDAETRTGFLSTSFIPGTLEPGEKEAFEIEKMSIDMTYYYRENRRGERTGTFVFSVFFQSRKTNFLANNSLIVLDEGKTTNIGKPKRRVTSQDGLIGEVLMYKVPRNVMERAANNEGVYFKVGQHVIWLTGARYLLYNMLQITK